MTSSFLRRTAVPTLAKSCCSTVAFALVIFVTIILNPLSAQTPKKGDAGMDPKAAAFNKKGMAYFRQNDYAKAIVELSKAIEQDPSNSYYIKNRGMAYRENKDFDKALADFTKAVKIKPDYAAAYLERGKTHYQKPDFERAIADFTQAIKIHPTYAQAYEARSLAYQKKGDEVRAKADLQEAQRLAGDAENPKGPVSKDQPPDPVKKEIAKEDSKPAPKPPLLPPGKHDPIVSSNFAITSNAYGEFGFRDYLFGTSQEQIKKQGALQIRKDNARWLINKKNDSFLFEDDKLRGIAKAYMVWWTPFFGQKTRVPSLLPCRSS